MELTGIKTSIKSKMELPSQFGIQLNKEKYNQLHKNMKFNLAPSMFFHI